MAASSGRFWKGTGIASKSDFTGGKEFVVALAAIKEFLSQPRSAQNLELLKQAEIGGLRDIETDAVSRLVRFVVLEPAGVPRRFTCDPASLALLSVIILLGQSLLVNVNRAGERSYLKVFGRRDESAAIVFARVLAGAEGPIEAEPGETTRYLDGDQTNLRHGNIVISGRSRSVRKGTVNVFEDAFSYVAECSHFEGDLAEKGARAKQLFGTALGRVREERGALVSGEAL